MVLGPTRTGVTDQGHSLQYFKISVLRLMVVVPAATGVGIAAFFCTTAQLYSVLGQVASRAMSHAILSWAFFQLLCFSTTSDEINVLLLVSVGLTR